MHRLALTASIFLLIFSAAARAQSIARPDGTTNANSANNDARNAVKELQRLENDVIVYRSIREFEASGKLARVSLRAFEDQLDQVTSSVDQMLARMPPSRIRSEITNCLTSYRDGAYWWGKIHQQGVVTLSALRYENQQVTAADTNFTSTIPYTVAIHWRQAFRYLTQAENAIDQQ